jgi:hypothetical protein
MTSAINYASINENFPIAGQDNDTQVFRDNFDTIKTSLRVAQEEISDLQDDTAKLNEDNDFGTKEISRAILRNNWNSFVNGIVSASDTEVSLVSGNYQQWTVNASSNITFVEFPINEDPLFPRGMGKVTLELISDGSPRVLTFISEGGAVFKKRNWPTGNNTLTVSSSSDPIILEVWRYSSDTIFLNYIGQFS